MFSRLASGGRKNGGKLRVLKESCKEKVIHVHGFTRYCKEKRRYAGMTRAAASASIFLLFL